VQRVDQRRDTESERYVSLGNRHLDSIAALAAVAEDYVKVWGR